MSRGADRQDIFTTDGDFLRFENLLDDGNDRFGIEIHAYAFMSNHVHLVVRCPDGALSDAMQFVLSRYAAGYNHIYEREGSLFTGRFRSVLIESDSQLDIAGRYVHRNPLAFVPVRALANYRWSSYGVYLGRRRRPDWLRVETLTQCFGGEVTRYRSFVESPNPADRTPMLGAEVVAPSLERIDRVVACLTNTDREHLLESTRGVQNDPRLLAISTAVDMRAAPTSSIAQHYRFDSLSSVRAAARRSRTRAAVDERFRVLRDRVRNELARAA